jgi:isopentenyl diphosphate isomerase/L-lactate dehydrogenase-like FMN-dependent dehydrogenase
MIQELKGELGCKVIVRGITNGEDALKAVNYGADGVWVTA